METMSLCAWVVRIMEIAAREKNRLLLLAADCIGKPLQALKEALTGCSTTIFVEFVVVGRQKVE